MIHEIAPHCYHNEYRPQAPDRNSTVLCYRKRETLLGRNQANEIHFPTFGELENLTDNLYDSAVYLFTIDGHPYYLGNGLEALQLPGYAWESLEAFRTASPSHLCFAGITGAQLNRWYKSRRFCGRCGRPMRLDEKERMMRCDGCSQQEYPKIMPAVIVAVTHKDRILLTQYADRDYKKYALIAGFAEIGEPIEDTVRREVMEEVGLRVKDIRYYKSQPWSFTDTLLFGFYAELDGEDTITLDQEELALAKWFDRKDIPVEANHVSLTNEMIVRFKEGNDCGTEGCCSERDWRKND